MERHGPLPEAGDVLVSRVTATREYFLTVVPTADCVMRATANTAVKAGLELAQELDVDLWLTEDHIHFLKVAIFRAQRQRSN
jgi:hypothetical protein